MTLIIILNFTGKRRVQFNFLENLHQLNNFFLLKLKNQACKRLTKKLNFQIN